MHDSHALALSFESLDFESSIVHTEASVFIIPTTQSHSGISEILGDQPKLELDYVRRNTKAIAIIDLES